MNRVLSVRLATLLPVGTIWNVHHDIAMAVDHVGRAMGLVTITDAMAAITSLTRSALKTNADFVHLDEGSWLVGGRVELHRSKIPSACAVQLSRRQAVPCTCRLHGGISSTMSPDRRGAAITRNDV